MDSWIDVNNFIHGQEAPAIFNEMIKLLSLISNGLPKCDTWVTANHNDDLRGKGSSLGIRH